MMHYWQGYHRASEELGLMIRFEAVQHVAVVVTDLNRAIAIY